MDFYIIWADSSIGQYLIFMIFVKGSMTTIFACRASITPTTGKQYSFIGTDEYIQIIFVCFETDEHNFIFVSWVWEPTNIWVVRFDLDRPHIFVG
jgi:hypothetical protein